MVRLFHRRERFCDAVFLPKGARHGDPGLDVDVAVVHAGKSLANGGPAVAGSDRALLQ